jgi:hypothetical protein
MTTYAGVTLDASIEHHGIKGQKWGVRRNLHPSGSNSNVKIGSGEAAPLIAVGAVYTALALRALYTHHIDSGKSVQSKTKNTPWKVDRSLSKKMSADDIYDRVVKQVNPNYGAKGTSMNCRRCTFAFEMRRRGYDVKATTSKFATGQDTKGLNSVTSNRFKKSSESIWGEKQISSAHLLSRGNPESRAKEIFSALSKNPEGARGELAVQWAFGGGHSMAWEIIKGKPVVFDTQNAKTYRDSGAFASFTPIVHDAAYTRLDNIHLDDAFIRRWVQNA